MPHFVSQTFLVSPCAHGIKMLKQLAIPHGAQLRFEKTFYRTSPTYKNVEALRSPLCPRGHVDMFGVEKSNILLV